MSNCVSSTNPGWMDTAALLVNEKKTHVFFLIQEYTFLQQKKNKKTQRKQ